MDAHKLLVYHDSEASFDPRCRKLIDEMGFVGYGIYWYLIENLRMQKEYKIPLAALPLDYMDHEDADLFDQVVHDYDLFKVDGEYFLSIDLNRRMEQLERHRRSDSVGAVDEKYAYGRFENVCLTDEEVRYLQMEYPKWCSLIDELSIYMESTGKTYKSHYATLLRWIARKDAENKTHESRAHRWDFLADWADERGNRSVF